MQPEVLKAIGSVIGLLVSLPLVVVCIRVVLFFGELRTGVRSLTSGVESLAGTLEEFTKEVRRDLRDIDGRVLVLEDRLEVPR